MYKKLTCIAPLLAEAMPDFIAITIKPQCTKKYMALTPISQRKVLLMRFKEQIERMKKHVDIVAYELHYERFQNGNLHAHGVLYIQGDLKDTVWADQFQKDFINHNIKLGKYCCTAKLPFGDNPLQTWLDYVNKTNALDPSYFIVSQYQILYEFS